MSAQTEQTTERDELLAHLRSHHGYTRDFDNDGPFGWDADELRSLHNEDHPSPNEARLIAHDHA
jgi:hypothetical protein